MTVTDDPLTLFDPLEAAGVVLRHDLVPGVGLHPAVARWFETRFPHGPTAPQSAAWPEVAAGRHTLIAAPTGSGKTLAGFLMGINRFYLDHAAGRPCTGTRVVYVSPLKALAVDIAENLERPLTEIAEAATTLGLAAPELTIGVRTGDTPASERTAMVKRQPSFLVTTPESLYLMLTAAKSREILAGVETVIVDEIHALARDKRGSHLCLTLERLTHVARRPPARIGLSATQKPIERVAALLVGDRVGADGRPDCAIVDAGHQRALDLAIELPDAEVEAVASHSQMDQVLDHIAELVGQHHTTIVFVNARRMAERLAHQLSERLGDDVVSAHHGSLSKDRRLRVERRLRAGELKVLVATASLELGIDIGPVELVCQIGSPRSIATFLQRVGRSNHSRYGTPKGRLFPLTRDELVECVALLRAVRAGRLDQVHPPEAPLDILAQQLIAESAAAEWRTDDLFALVRRAHPYRELSRESFDAVIAMVSDGIQTGRGRRAAYVHHDAVNGEVRGRKGARLAALTSGGAIPEIGDYRVVLEPDGAVLGSVNEDWAVESMAGDIFLLGTHSWQIRKVGGGEVRVVDAQGKPPTVPFWTGEAPARTYELSAEVSELRSTVDGYLDRDDPAGGTHWLVADAGVTTEAAALVVAYLTAGRAMLGHMPTQQDLVIERFFDESGGMQLVIHSPYGGRINRAMGYALRKKFCRSFNFELQASANDDLVVISLGPHHSFPLTDVPRYLTAATIPDTLTQAVLDQPVFLLRWRWNLNRALVVLRWRGGKRNPPPIQRMEADDLMAAVFPNAAACQENVTFPIAIPDHPLVAQTVHDALTEGLDVSGLAALWERIDAGEVRVHCVDTTEPSVLSHEILTAKPYAFLDGGEAVDRRTNAVPLRRGLPLRPAELGSLDESAVERVREEVRPLPATPDELHDLLAALVLTPPRDEWRELFEQLVTRGRVATTADGRWHVIEAGTSIEVLEGGVPIGEIFPELVAAEVVRGHLDIEAARTATELAAMTGLSPTLTAVALATLEAEGAIFQGRFIGEPAEVQWASRRLLARMHAYSRRQRRASVEPVAALDFVRFLARWQHVTPGSQVTGVAGLRTVLAQLQGSEAPAAAWEPAILSARLRDYRASWLDRLCHDGEVGWLRLTPRQMEDPDRRGSGPSKATPMTVVFRSDLTWLLAAHRGDAEAVAPSDGALAEIVAALDERGACFATELCTATGRLITDLEAGLWDGVSRGLITGDGFEAIRCLLGSGSTPRPRTPSPNATRSLSRLRRGAPTSTSGAGRWALVPTPEPIVEREELAEAVADQLLARWGVVFYDLVAHEGLAMPWRELQWALRRLEDRGLVAGGRFVAGRSGEQFALPNAVEALAAVRRSPHSGATVQVCAADPLNLTGVLLPGPRVPAIRTNHIDVPV